MNAPDLFGGETKVCGPVRNQYQRFRLEKHYRKAEGSENCGNCWWQYQIEFSKTYRKCRLMGGGGSSASDVSRRMVCNGWEKSV